MRRFVQFLPTVTFLLFVLVAGNYLLSPSFALYDDDFIFTLPALSKTWSETTSQMWSALRSWPQGRPVGFAVAHLFSFFTASSDSLMPGYVLGCALLLINGCLIFSLARRFVVPGAAVLAAVVYLLYPIENSKVILMHRVFAHLNITLLLLSLFCYVRGNRVVLYLLAPLSFLIYEPVAVIYLIAPLLLDSRASFSFRRCLFHGLAIAATIALLLVCRSQMGDARVSETFASPTAILRRVATAEFVGPFTSVSGLIMRPLDALRSSDSFQWLLIILTAMLFIFLSGARTNEANASSEGSSAESTERSWLLALTGAIGLFLGYCLCFRDDYWPPVMTIGRISVFHVTGSVGCALMVGGLFSAIWQHLPRWRSALIGAAAVYCGLLTSFGLEVQKVDYLTHAQQQARFWQRIIDTSDEWRNGTIVVVDISGNDPSRPTTQGMPIYWLVNFAPVILEHYVDWPSPTDGSMNGAPRFDPKKRPRVFGYVPGFATEPTEAGIRLKSPGWMGAATWPEIQDHNFIYFRFVNGAMERQLEPVTFGDKSLHPIKPKTISGPVLGTSHTYRMLFEHTSDWPTILRSRNYPR